jgi:PAS domain S-box-containing protein
MLVKKPPISAERHDSHHVHSHRSPAERSSRTDLLEPGRRQGSRFESFLAAFSAALASTSSDRAGEAILTWLRKLARLSKVDCLGLWEWRPDNPDTGVRCVSATCEIDDRQIAQAMSSCQWLAQQFREGRVVTLPRIPDDVPIEAVAERAGALEIGAKSALAIPMRFGKSVYVIAFISRRHYRTWPQPAIRRLRVVGDLLLQAVLRQEAEREMSRGEFHAPESLVARYGQGVNRQRRGEQSFRAVFEQSAVGIALIAPDGRWLELNPVITHLLGYSRAELRELDFQSLTHPDDLGVELSSMRRVLAGETDHYELEKRYLHKDGHVVATSLTATLVRDRDSQPSYFVHQLVDLTERKQAQLESARLRAQLAHAGRMSLTSHLTASLAHQLLQPVTAILANVDAGQHALRAASSPKLAPLEPILQDIAICGRAAAEIIERVRSLLRSEPQPFEPLDFDQLVGDVTKLIQGRLIVHKIRMIMSLNAASSVVVGDRVQLQQLVLNLLMNAVDAMSDGVVTEPLLVVSTASGVRELELTVRDRGVGINAAFLQRMFDPFFTTKPGGMGMGLYLAGEIVRAHGGKIWAESNEGPGLTLHCLLPAYVRTP